jgi:hypothetical protein
MKKNVIILKNDRGGDLLNSIKPISTILSDNNSVTIFLSQYNFGFAFLFKKAIVKKINYNLNILNKIYLFFFILKSNCDEIYILTPKNFYYFLPVIFRKIKFYGITVNGFKRYRPSIYLRKFLYKFVTISRRTINNKSSSDLQLELIDNNNLKDINYQNLYLPKLDSFISQSLPEKFIFIQFKEIFFKKINLVENDFLFLLKQINKKFKYIVFFSDIEKTVSNNFFIDNLNFIDCKSMTTHFKSANPNIIYLHNINIENLFSLVEKSSQVLSPHGLMTHMAKFYKKKNLNLFNFIISNKSDLDHQKIAFSEWYKDMNIKFSFLDKNINKTVNKILKNL